MCGTGYVPFIGNWRSRLLQEVHGLVLEVGAGSGPNLEHYPREARVIATEFNEESIALARPRSSARIRLVSADIEHLAFPDNTQRTSNMLLSILHLYGIDMGRIGTSTGRLQPLEMA